VTRETTLTGAAAIREALAKLGLHYSYSWVLYACSHAFRGTPIPVTKLGNPVKPRILIRAGELMDWVDKFKRHEV
jgi:hypothetical protein